MMSRGYGCLDHFTYLCLGESEGAVVCCKRPSWTWSQDGGMHILSICILLLVALIKRNDVVEPIRSCRRLLRNSGWWDTVWKYSEARFKKTFRVTRGTFLYILSRIRQQLERQTVTEDPIFPELRLAICLYRLGRGWLLLHHCRNDRTRGFNRMHYCTRGFTSYYRLYVGREYFKAHSKIWGRI